VGHVFVVGEHAIEVSMAASSATVTHSGGDRPRSQNCPLGHVRFSEHGTLTAGLGLKQPASKTTTAKRTLLKYQVGV
jgi:hypothetical protein